MLIDTWEMKIKPLIAAFFPLELLHISKDFHSFCRYSANMNPVFVRNRETGMHYAIQ